MKTTSAIALPCRGGIVLCSTVLLAGCTSSSNPAPKPSDGGSTTVQWRAAVGAGGTLVQTFDDRTWTRRSVAVASGVAPDLFGVACVGNLNGWAAGAGGAIAHTTDGGQTWGAQDSRTTATLRAIRFGDALHGAAVGDVGTLLVTSDGGGTWRSVSTGFGGSLRGVVYAGALVVAAGDGGMLLVSSDAGMTFARRTVDGAGDFHGIASDPGAHLVVAVDAKGGAWASSDGAHGFAREAIVGAALDAIAIRDDGAIAIAAGASGTVLARDAAGAWHAAKTGTTRNLHAALVEATGVYVAGDDGAILEAVDPSGGWSTIDTGTHAALWALEDL
jgi:photosystem II stability/assembly factor-like uncharacterized protein